MKKKAKEKRQKVLFAKWLLKTVERRLKDLQKDVSWASSILE